MKYLKTFEALTYSGKDVTRMPIIGRILTKKMEPFEECIYNVVEIIKDPKIGDVYVCNFWYKPRVPQIIHSSMVEKFEPKEIKCKCGWHWKASEGGKDFYICHKCGHDNTPEK